MKRFQRIISLMLALVLTLGTVPVTARAEETVPETTAVETMEVITEPTAGTAVPTEAETEPTGSTTAPTEAETQPTEGTTAPTEAETQPIEGTTAPTEETVPMETVENASQEAANAASGSCGSSATWSYADGVLTISGSGRMSGNSYNSTPWDDYKYNVKTVIVAEGITAIDMYAFNGCSALTAVSLPSTLTEIGYGAFYFCSSLREIVIPDSVTTLRDSVFFGCSSMVTAVLPKNLKTLGSSMFASCNALVSVTLPKNLETMKSQVFSGCTSLESIDLPDTLKTIESMVFSNCSSLTEVILPERLTYIGSSAFSGCDALTEMRIPAGVETVEQGAFAYSDALQEIIVAEGNPWYTSNDGVLYTKDMTTLLQYPAGKGGRFTVPTTVRTFGRSAFGQCTKLTAVTIPKGVTEIPGSLFSLCTGLETVALPDTVTSIGSDAFSDCEKLVSIVLPENLTNIGDYAFENCTSLTEIVIPEGVYHIGMCTFQYCENLSQVTLPESLTGIDIYAFSETALTSVEIPEGVTNIGHCAFSYTLLQNVRLPSTLTTISEGIFCGCQDLQTVTFTGDAPVFENNIGMGTFYWATATVYYPKDNPTWTPDVLQSYGGTVTWIAGDGSGAAANLTYSFDESTGTLTIQGDGPMGNYVMSTVPWRQHREKVKSVVIEDGITTIGTMAFCNFQNLTQVSIPSSVAEIADNAFAYCTDLTSVTIPSGVTKIGKKAFLNCRKLSRVTIPGGVTEIGSEAFSGCSGMTSLTLKEGIAKIGTGAFALCASLTEVTIPASLTVLGDGAFGYCEKLQTFVVADDSQSFVAVDGILYDKTVTTMIQVPAGYEGVYRVPETVRKIRNKAVWRCQNLQELVFTGTITEIGLYAFYESVLTIRHPEDVSWQVLQGDYGGTITWEPYTPGSVGDPDYKTRKTLAELTELDYMAFAHVIYQDFKNNETVQQCMVRHKKWEEKFGDKGVTIALLCEGIADWKVCRIKENTKNGFYAAAFQNSYGEVVIAYRGSEDIDKLKTSTDAKNDWFENDFPMIIFDSIGDKNQLGDAFDMYEEVQKKCKPSEIHVTGHSLGGGLGDAVSARYGCIAETFNAISMLDVVYYNYPQRMGANFAGVDKWKITDHANEYDIIAGTFETQFGQRIKPYKVYKSNHTPEGLKVLDYFPCHSLHSYVTIAEDEKPELTECVSVFSPGTKISQVLTDLQWKNPLVAEVVHFGTSGKDKFHYPQDVTFANRFYGGNGDDTITASIKDDVLIGGRGNDTLDGRFGSDTYIYYKGDGRDTIYDVGGADELILKNFADDDIIQIMEDDNTDFIHINCNGEDIVRIYKKNRDYEIASLSSFKVVINGKENNITSFFNKWRSGYSLLAHCPVDVEVLDAQGNVVYILEDGVAGSWYTEYGNFYVFEEENGEYGKILDLREGYTARIVGVDAGTMDIDYREVVDGELAEPKNFADVPVTTDFTAIFEETEDGELVLAADTDGDNIVDTKIGYDGKAIPADGITLQQEYLALKPGETAQLEAEVQPAALAELLQWRVEGKEGILSVSRTGEVVAQNVGSVYVIASVSDGENEMTARCRIDVAETDALKPEKIDIEGVHLGTATVTTELYSTDYAEFEVLLQLPQNDPNSMTAARTAAMAVEERMPNTGVTIDDARFVAPEVRVDLNDLFGLQVLDDRRIRIVPTQDAVDNPKTVAGRYTGKVEVLIQEEWMPVEEVLTLTVRKTMPRLKAMVAPFNSFYSGQSQPIVITGGTPVKIYEDASKTTAIPTWLELMEDGTLTLKEDAPLRSVAGVGYVRVETEEWRIPVSMTLSVRNVYKTPGLRLSASAVTMTTLAEQSDGVELKLLCNNRKETLEDLNVTGITAPEGYAVENFTVADGSFTLKTKAGFQPGRIPLTIAFGDTSVTTALNLVVRTTPVTLRLSSAAVTLNQAVADTAEIKVTAAPADFRIEEPTIRLTGTEKVNGRNTTVDKLESGELDVRFENGVIRIATTYLTPKTATYKLYISAGGSREATATIRVIHAVPTVTYRASGVMDLSFPEQAAAIIPTFRNYSGGFEIEEMTAQNAKREEVTYFHLSQEGKQILVTCDETTPAGAYTLTLGLTLDDGTPVKNTVRVTVRRTAVRLKLSAARVTLNKELKDTATVSVSCLTKGYAFALAKEMISCDESRLTVSVNGNELTIGLAEDAEFGKTYPIEIHACEGAPVMRLNVAVLRENTVVRSTIRATGFIDVLRGDSAIMIQPSYTNVGNVEKQTKLVIYSNADRDNFKTPIEETELPFDFTVDGEGVFTLTANEKLDHSVAYRAKLVSIFGEGDTARTVESAMIPLSVRMGAARLTLTASGTTLFAKDRKDRAVIRFETADATLNDVAKVEFRDARQAEMFEIIGYGNGAYAIGFKDEKVHESLIATGKATSKAVVVPLNVFITGNKTTRANTTVNVKLTIMK